MNFAISTDDRTGALDTGAACAEAGFETIVLPFEHPALIRGVPDPDLRDAACWIVDTRSRHLTPNRSRQRVLAVHRRFEELAPDAVVCHKLDSTLRGHWPLEVAGLIEAGAKVGIVAAYPAAGRTCVDGVVTVHGIPVAETEFANDPLNPVRRSRPADVLAEYAVREPQSVVFDAVTELDMLNAARVCRDEGRVLVGTAGSIGAMARLIGGVGAWRRQPLPHPIAFVCGSLHPASRRQIERLGLATISPQEPIEQLENDVVITTTPLAPDARLTVEEAEATAEALAEAAWSAVRKGAKTLVSIGGDTTSAVVGQRIVRVRGVWSFGMPVCDIVGESVSFVAKPGSFGERDALVSLLVQSVG